MKNVLTIGSFDCPHGGHISLFEKCKKIADNLIVSINTDEFIKDYKGAAPIMNYEERKRIISAFRSVDEVIPNSGGKDCKPTILASKCQFLIVGSDWAQKEKRYLDQISVTKEWLDEQNIILLFVPYTEGISSTELKRRILAG